MASWPRRSPVNHPDSSERHAELALELPRVGFVDAYDISLTSDGRARPELFVKDRLHFAAEGYKPLAERVRPFLAQ